ncbi:GPI ethanolamine phosphate transferase 2-like [Cervus canadensis]|uniref:GPI ethanolamine phosphate transferase 2-like n=1 Tax=Cervus canadensis TaxID=1574408 RepID=UPI001C9E46E3|nr:GPI ethanolamine phosphate transferase 2-like [Cervus canadensis]
MPESALPEITPFRQVHRKYSWSPGSPLRKRLTLDAYFRRDGGRGKDAASLSGATAPAYSAAVEARASPPRREVTRCPGIRISARRVGTMRLGSGTFAAGCVVIEVLGVALFLRGFFPTPVFSGAERQAESPAPEPSAGASSNWTELPPPLFSKVVIMLIDALRDDFVFGSKGVKFMPYTTYLVERGSSLSFVAEAKPPTVTMPRIKVLAPHSSPVRNWYTGTPSWS